MMTMMKSNTHEDKTQGRGERGRTPHVKLENEEFPC